MESEGMAKGAFDPLKSDPKGVSFTIPSMPPSMNSMYNVLFGLRKVELKPEARLWKSKAKEFIPKHSISAQERVSINFLFFGSWLSKEGKILKRDVTNREKLILDAISEKCGWDDSQVWHRTVGKVQSEKEYVKVSYFVMGIQGA